MKQTQFSMYLKTKVMYPMSKTEFVRERKNIS